MKYLEQVRKYLLVPFIIMMIVLSYQVYKLPDAIKKASGNVIYETRTVELKTKGDFIFFEGNRVDSSFVMIESYAYDTSYPEDIYSGYLTRFKGRDKSEVYIWSHNALDIEDIQGWFLADNQSKFGVGDNKTYLQILYPIVESDIRKK